MFKMLFRVSTFFIYNLFLPSNNYLENTSQNEPKSQLSGAYRGGAYKKNRV
jgi:hypothetical protein